ncbi:hypothetical protein [Nocardia anaemiae]|uniref:hypothetical protein n=1 Tax=Nocardia anaemiae TaxID=263910 RepID=UPI0007A511C3|nr:hypothetical protein [Nocardia anaemiae]
MAHTTPWQEKDVQLGRFENDDDLIGEVTAQRFDLRSDWAYLCAPGLSLLTFLLLFQPWISATGPNGTISANAFGRIDGFTTGSFQSVISISSTWAVLTTLAIAGTIVSTVLFIRIRNRLLSYLVLGCTSAAALFVLAALAYLNGKVPELREITESAKNTGLFSWLFGDNSATNLLGGEHRIASAGLDLAATLAAITACGAALAAGVMSLRKEGFTVRLISTPQPNVTAAESPSETSAQKDSEANIFLWEQLAFDDDLAVYDPQVRRRMVRRTRTADRRPPARETALTR